jgi:hypothetical protein
MKKYYRLLTLVLCVLSISVPLNAQQQNLVKILKPYDRIKPDNTGSYDVSSYSMSLGVRKPAVFNKIGSNQQANTYSWGNLPSGSSNGVNSYVSSLASDGNGNIYVGGDFTQLGDGTSANHIAKWNGSSWSTLPSGSSNGVDGKVLALTSDGNGNIYVGGYFTHLSDGTSANYVAKWNGSSWSTLPSGSSNGVNSIVRALASDGKGNIYVGGYFTQLGDGTSANHIAKWNGSSWSTLQSGTSNGVNSNVYSLASDNNGNLYVGGVFYQLGDGTSANYIAKWNSNSWSSLPSGLSNGVNNGVSAISISSNGKGGIDVYVGGYFTQLGDGTSANYIAKWNSSGWSILPSSSSNGVNNIVYALSSSTNDTGGTDAYIGGYFTQLGDGTSANFIAKWNGSNLTAIDNGTNDYIQSLAISASEGKLYLGGIFSVLNSTTPANHVGKLSYSSNPLAVKDVTSAAPANFNLAQNYPNPFNPSTNIKYTIPNVSLSGVEGSRVQLKVYDMLGNEVATLVNESKPAGTYEVEFNASNLSSGIYFYKLQSGNFVETKKMVLMK